MQNYKKKSTYSPFSKNNYQQGSFDSRKCGQVGSLLSLQASGLTLGKTESLKNRILPFRTGRNRLPRAPWLAAADYLFFMFSTI